MARVNNPKNNESDLFKKLTRLFSGPLVNWRSQTPRRLRRRQLDRFKFTSASGKQFQKQEYYPFHDIRAGIMGAMQRAERYSDFDQMEYTPEIASSIDIYADEMTTHSGIQPMMTIKCPNEEIKAILNALYSSVLNLEANLFGWCRTLCKFGDYFLYLDIDEEHGVQNVVGLPTHEIERLEGEDKTNPNYVQYQWNSAGLTLENWQVAHFRILGNDKYAPYGTSVLEASRRIWRQLTLLEDAMMAYRIVRSPERRVFYIDVGNINPTDVEQYMQKVVTQMKRNQVVDPDTGRVDLRYNPMSVEEDYFIPTRGGVSSRVESLAGGAYTGDIDDVKYLRDKLFASLKIPMSYLIRGEGSEEDKTTLAQKDIRFARTIQRLQRSVIAELEKIGIIHLFTLGYRGDDLISFKLALNNPSKIAELQELEHWRAKFDAASAATEGFFSKRWIATKMFNMSEEEFLRNQREMFYDRKFQTELDAIAEAMAAAGEFGGELGAEELGADLGGEEDFGDEELGGDLGDEELAAEEPDTALLASPDEPPAKRAEQGYKQAVGRRFPYDKDGKAVRRKGGKIQTKGPNQKDWYEPKTNNMHSAGRRRMHYRGQYADEVGRATKRNVTQGLSSIGKGIYKEEQSNYSEEESQLFEINYEVKKLITELESKERTEDKNNGKKD